LITSQYQLSRGTLILRNGAQMISSGGVTSLVGQIDGTMTVEGADTRWITSNGYLIVGANSSTSSSGSGTLNILDGGIVDASGASSTAIGGYRPLLPDGSGFLEPTHGTGVMNVSGSGSGLLASALHVGSIGIGTLNIADGGKVNSHGEGHAGSYAYLARWNQETRSFELDSISTPGRGNITVSGAGSQWNHDGQHTFGYGGEGALVVE